MPLPLCVVTWPRRRRTLTLAFFVSGWIEQDVDERLKTLARRVNPLHVHDDALHRPLAGLLQEHFAIADDVDEGSPERVTKLCQRGIEDEPGRTGRAHV